MGRGNGVGPRGKGMHLHVQKLTFTVISRLYQFTSLTKDYKYVNIAVLIVMLIIETLRLFLGYEGNLREKVCPLA